MDKIRDKMTGEYELVARKYIKGVEDFGIPVEKAYLFGSRVKGNNRKNSDLDICVVSPAFGTDDTAEWVFLMKVARKFDDSIEPHPFSPRDFNNKYNLLAQEIKRTGVEVAI